jgi:hypothetical protein
MTQSQLHFSRKTNCSVDAPTTAADARIVDRVASFNLLQRLSEKRQRASDFAAPRTRCKAPGIICPPISGVGN